MSTVNLAILGLLKKRPMSAYELANILDGPVLGKLVKASAPAVYKNLKKMQKYNYLSSETVKEGEMPSKKVYSMTQKGDEHFLQLMEQYSSNFTPFYMDFNAFILNLDKIDKENGLKMLNKLKSEIIMVKGWMEEHRKQAGKVFFAGRMLMLQVYMILETLIQWMDQVMVEYQQEQDLGVSPF